MIQHSEDVNMSWLTGAAWTSPQGRWIGVECKRADAPALTLSMRIALADLMLDKLFVVYPGEKRYPLAKQIEVVPLAQMVDAA